MSLGQVSYLQGTSSTPAAADGNGIPDDTSGQAAGQIVEVVESNGGTCTLTLEGSFDGSNWYAAGYQRIDAQATLTRAATGISVAANTRRVYQVTDPYPQLRARISSSASTPNVTVKLYTVAT